MLISCCVTVLPVCSSLPTLSRNRVKRVRHWWKSFYRFRDRLPEKLRYLADAPQQDPEGNKTMVRFSRKTKQQYVSSEKDGKATGWSAFYVDGKWVEGKK